MSRAIETVAVVGRDAPVWIAAAALHRAVGKAGVKVQVVELPSLLSPVDVYAALPSIRGLHQLLGLDDPMILAASDGVPVVGHRFSNWSGAAPPFVHGYDDAPPPGGDLDFVHYWAKGRLEGLKVPFEDFSLAAVMAKQGRVPALADQDPALSATFGVQLDARGYSSLLKQFAAHLGIAVTSGTIREVERDGDRISAVVLADGERVEADLFVDASGTEAALISKLDGAEFEPWSDWLPCNRTLSASAPALQPLPAFSQVSAFRGGWIALHPLRDRTAIVAVYDTQRISDQEMVDTLPILTRLAIAGDAVVSPLRPGVQKRSWIGNCVAVGEAAVALEPLDAVQLHLTHMCVSHLVTLFPVTADELPEAAAYSSAIRWPPICAISNARITSSTAGSTSRCGTGRATPPSPTACSASSTCSKAAGTSSSPTTRLSKRSIGRKSSSATASFQKAMIRASTGSRTNSISPRSRSA
jgi:tryptophan halogenase